MSEEKKPGAETPSSAQGAPTFVTPLASVAEQMGRHVIAALGHPNTVAVITTVTGSQTGQKIVSMALDPEQMNEVNALLAEIEESDTPEQIDCVGFHCDFDSTTGDEG